MTATTFAVCLLIAGGWGLGVLTVAVLDAYETRRQRRQREASHA